MTGEMKEKAPAAAAVIVAIIAIAFLIGFALHLGHDGALLTLGVGAIAGLGGFKVRDIFKGR